MDRKGKLWTEEEVIYLKEFVGNYTFTEISKRLQRTENAIKRKVETLKLGRINELNGLLTAHSLAKLLQIDGSRVIQLIQKHNLPATRKNYRFSSEPRRRHYSICQEEFWNWAKDHKHLLDFTKLTKDSLPPEPSWVEEERKSRYEKGKDLHRKPWTNQEIQRLILLKNKGYTHKKIASALSRTPSAVEKKVKRLREKEEKN